MEKALIIDNLKNNSNLYLAPSKVCDGVGVFALIDISNGVKLFPDVNTKKHYVTWEELKDLDRRVLEKLKSLCNIDDGGIYLPSSLNNFDFSYFVNHSKDYNVFHDLENDEYFTIKDIKEGEEILCNYNSGEIDW
jgi:SET domain-containing protein